MSRARDRSVAVVTTSGPGGPVPPPGSPGGPLPPPGAGQPMTRAAAAAARPAPQRRQPRPGPYWAGVAATAVMSALIGLLGALVARDILNLDLRLRPGCSAATMSGGSPSWRGIGDHRRRVARVALRRDAHADPVLLLDRRAADGRRRDRALLQGGTTGDQVATAVIVLLIGVSLLSILPGVAARTMRPI